MCIIYYIVCRRRLSLCPATAAHTQDDCAKCFQFQLLAKANSTCPPEVFELLHKHERKRAVQTVKLEVEASEARSDGQPVRCAESVLQKALLAEPGSAPLLAPRWEAAEQLEQAEQIASQKEAELLAELEGEIRAGRGGGGGTGGGVAEPAGAKSKAQMKRERQRRRQKEQAARDELAALLDELGLSKHLTLCLDNEMDVGAPAISYCATLGHHSIGTYLRYEHLLFQQVSRLTMCCVRRCIGALLGGRPGRNRVAALLRRANHDPFRQGSARRR